MTTKLVACTCKFCTMKCILLMWSANKVFIFPTNTSENKPFVIWCKEIKTIANEAQSAILKAKGEGSPYSITERRVPELIPVLCSQPAGVMSHKPGGRLTLLSARPVVTSAILKRAATNFAAWWTGARWVWTVCLRLLPDSVATAIEPGPSAPESSTLTTRLPSHPSAILYAINVITKKSRKHSD